jgi:hypothetical protein
MSPLVVTGEPLTLNPVGATRPTLVTVPPPPPVTLALIVTTPSLPVPEVAKVMLLPSASCSDPPEPDSVTVWLVALEVLLSVWSPVLVPVGSVGRPDSEL